MTSRVKHHSAGLRAAPGAGRCRRQGNIYFYATVVTAAWLRLGCVSLHLHTQSAWAAPATTMSPLTAAPPHQRGTGPELRQQSLRIKIHVMGQFLILQ